jgi:bifunctional N-acetylglucosamine-1-phosphate-uridyltransferase/glucosamine-1-phosphate-acetyltransferase GlmU-like protein
MPGAELVKSSQRGRVPPLIEVSLYIPELADSALAPWAGREPWALTMNAEAIVTALLGDLSSTDFAIREAVAIHRSAAVEQGAVVKQPAIIGPSCFVAAGAYVRGGVWLERDVILGPGSELKSSFVFGGSKLAHLNFVGDSLVGADVNFEAGSIVANYRNERANKEIHVRRGSALVPTGVQKFGALVGSHARIGANAVLAPGTLIGPEQVVRRMTLVDQEEESRQTP